MQFWKRRQQSDTITSQNWNILLVTLLDISSQAVVLFVLLSLCNILSMATFPAAEVKRLTPSENIDLNGTATYVIKECARIFLGERSSVVRTGSMLKNLNSMASARKRTIPTDKKYATSRKVSGSITDEVIGFFKCPNSSSHTMTIGSTQPLTEISTRDLLGVK
jgi:hypothetical protein